jgi:hypothetical protein
MVNVEIYKDVEFPGFNFRFVKRGDNWICAMPEFLLDTAIVMATSLFPKNVQK